MVVKISSSSYKRLKTLFDVSGKQKRISELEALMQEDGFWGDKKESAKVIGELNTLKNTLDTLFSLKKQFKGLDGAVDLLKESFDQEMKDMVEIEYDEAMEAFETFEVKVLLSHDYDQHNAIVELHPGAGGTESQDWASMLYRMYTRWAERKGFKVSVLHYLDGEEAGLKSVSFKVEGPMAFGLLKSEKGVHRLVRISPFDAGGRRHTSFASVDVMPEFNDNIEIVIGPQDIEVETMRASGAGGQHINKTDSAVRMTHKPSGIVVTCQSGRSQIQNREEALNMIKSKLYQLEIERQEAKLADIKGEQRANEWGSQIRSYVFAPYTLVKDVRTGVEEGNVGKVMDGDIDQFIYAVLKSNVK
jgi:peptide chain release factor 2